jgi:hypothetical protein
MSHVEERVSVPDPLDYADEDFADIFAEDQDADAAPTPAVPSPDTVVSSEVLPDAPPPTTPPTATPAASAPPSAPASQSSDQIPTATDGQDAPPARVPFTFAVDGQQVTVEGAAVVGDNIIIPKAAWDQVVRPRYLGDRHVWRQREAGLQQQLKEAASAKGDREGRAEAILAKVQELDTGGPEAWAQWLDNFHTTRPILEAEAKARVAEQRLHAIEQQRQEQDSAAQADSLVPRLQSHLDQALSQYLARDEFKVLAADADALKATLWDQAAQLFFEAPEDFPEAGLRQGDLGFRYDLFTRLLESHAAPARRLAAQVQQATQAAKSNAAAVAPTRPVAPTPAPSPPRDEAGRFVPTSPSEWKNKLLADDWSDIFSEE